LDKLVGYRGSPLVWRLNIGAKSIGRVQSATLHLVCQREREIQAFKPQDYWSVFVDYAEGFRAYYHGNAQAPRTPPDEEGLDDSGTEVQGAESTRVLSQQGADRLVALAQNHSHVVLNVEGKTTQKKPPAPFTTSSLQQAAGSRLKFSPEHTMQIAQKLYEAGHITYMRTDSVQLSPEFCAAAREWLQAHDRDNVPDKVAKQRSSKDAQEAHEAIRPTHVEKSSAQLKQELSEDEFKLYVLIWMRAIASQCKPAQLRKTQIITQSGSVQWQAKGQVVEFPGYAAYWKDLSGDSELPVVQAGQPLMLLNAAHEQKQTQPPPRYTEPKLVQLMERRGIGRPSTYAPTIATLKQRDYVELVKGKLLKPTEMGMQVDEFMGKALPDLLEADFTAQMESSLDRIAEGKADWQQYLIGWNQDYFEPALAKAKQIVPQTSGGGQRPGRQLEKSRTKCPSCTKPLSKVPTKKVKKGYFLKCENGCKGSDDKDLVLFWSDRTKQWQLPSAKPEGGTAAAPQRQTEYLCPVCGQPLAEVSYTKDGESKAMLKCSDPKAGGDRKHKDVVYFRGKEGKWWSPKFGNIEE
jgi:DNA topoisomerase-1